MHLENGDVLCKSLLETIYGFYQRDSSDGKLSDCQNPFMFLDPTYFNQLSDTFSVTPSAYVEKMIGGDWGVMLSSHSGDNYMLFLSNRPDVDDKHNPLLSAEVKDKDVLAVKYWVENGIVRFDDKCVRVLDKVWDYRTEPISASDSFSNYDYNSFFDAKIESDLSNIVHHYDLCGKTIVSSPKSVYCD